MINKNLFWILIFWIILCGCRKECAEKACIVLRPDWGKNETPRQLKVLLYGVNGNVMEYSLPGEGGQIEVAHGEYQVLFFNDDAQNVEFRELSSFENAYAVMSGTKATVNAPHALFSYGGAVTASGKAMQLLPVMKSLIVKAAVEINLEHAAGVASVESNIRNIPDAVTLGGGVPFYTAPDVENAIRMESGAVSGNTYVFHCNTFGSIALPDGGEVSPAPRILADIGITYETGETKVVTADITEAIEQATEGGGEVVIALEEIGFKAVVKGWVLKKGNGEIDDDK